MIGKKKLGHGISHTWVKPGKGQHIIFARLDTQCLINGGCMARADKLGDHLIHSGTVIPDVFGKNIALCAYGSRKHTIKDKE
jgi:hypothetical protein